MKTGFYMAVLKKNGCIVMGLVFVHPSVHASINEPQHEISNNVVCATSKASVQPAHTRSLIKAFATRLHIL